MAGIDNPGLLTRWRRGALRAVAAGPFYRHTLFGRVPDDLTARVGQRWPGDPVKGEAIRNGDIEFAGELVRNPSPTWFPTGIGPGWLAAWHGFGWFADLAAVGGNAREEARALVFDWLAENTAWHPIAWRSDVLATRIFAWIAHFDEILGRDPDPETRRRLLASLVRQLRHLARTAAWECAGADRLRALKGLVTGLAVLGGSPARLGKALRACERELAGQVLPDGGHVSRSPSLQLQVLQDLVDLRAVLRGTARPVPDRLQEAIERMAPMLRFFRHGDRRLALFNDSLEEDGVLIDLVLTRSEGKGQAPARADDTGFDRLQADRSLVIVDTGMPPPRGHDAHAHAGILSFEMSHERERIIVNCGAYRGPKANWRRVARATAAHSVLVVGDTNAIEIRDDGGLGRGPGAVTCERDEEGGRQWISGSHDGWRQRFGVTYARQLFLAADGEDLRGEDRLSGRPGANFAVRFHLHPAVEAAVVEEPDGSAAVLRLPSGSEWRLRAAGAAMSLGESVYLGSGTARKTQQVVLSGAIPPEGAAVRWALRREPRRPLGFRAAGDD